MHQDGEGGQRVQHLWEVPGSQVSDTLHNTHYTHDTLHTTHMTHYLHTHD